MRCIRTADFHRNMAREHRFNKLFLMRIVRNERDLRARQDRSGIAHGSVAVGGKRHIHLFRSGLRHTLDHARGERDVQQTLRRTVPLPRRGHSILAEIRGSRIVGRFGADQI